MSNQRLMSKSRQELGNEGREKLHRKLTEAIAKRRETFSEMQSLSTAEGRYKDLLNWISSIQLSKQPFDKTGRAFSDGVLVAEIIAKYFPQLCNPKNYFRALSTKNKLINWNHLNTKVLPHLGITLRERTIKVIISPLSLKENSCPYNYDHPLFKLLFSLQDALGCRLPSFYNYRRKRLSKSILKSENLSYMDAELANNERRPRSSYPMYSKTESLIFKHGSKFSNHPSERNNEPSGFELVPILPRVRKLPLRRCLPTTPPPSLCQNSPTRTVTTANANNKGSQKYMYRFPTWQSITAKALN